MRKRRGFADNGACPIEPIGGETCRKEGKTQKKSNLQHQSRFPREDGFFAVVAAENIYGKGNLVVNKTHSRKI